ncbi:hypothetical protein [Bifidobacterium gallicum]|uniref:Uncharacterized protein n=1 Tax=Bifidobacterium gallicum DSM 20093 = LMG 11596 TaxID=561180 RepID=D1NTH1_9BIFI|nr:hypothetical protein [Bifidobacterium gallicum]EFA23025.1 hypothetical protein BIFGAL_03129 [Bifidobacterium gallicum DSM 20093 = LMG 11596]KFI57666.1 hypothetical protein BGLCM_1355 [Bifidobacterium gallicum DSM 20093 = LMG 11596]
MSDPNKESAAKKEELKEGFEKIEERVAAARDSFQSAGEELKAKVKGAKEGWETAHAEQGDKHLVAEHEETHQTH